MRKSDGKRKSERKPFRDVSNRRIEPSKLTKKKKAESEPEANRLEEETLDHLLLIHSDISCLLRQIDELVMQAVEANETNLQERKEIVSFTYALSDILSSLKPWVPHFQKVLSGLSTKSENQPEQSSVDSGTSLIINGGNGFVVQGPEPTKLDLLVSPSPLVSWRAADCTMEMGKQLFALTPVPRPRTVISKSQPMSKSIAFERLTSNNTTSGLLSQLTIACEPNDNKLESSMKKSTLENLSPAKEINKSSKIEFSSPPKSAKGNCSTMILTTPCLKTSPPKSCLLLEPNHEVSNRNFDKYPKSIPFPLGNQKLDESPDSETSSSKVLENSGLKFTTILGIKPASELGNGGRKALYASPAWFRSPPKTCTLMEPIEEKSMKNDPLNTSCLEELANSFFKQNIDSAFSQEENVQGIFQPIAKSTNTLGSCVGFTESTPMWKEPDSTVYKGRQPGENTLKKELWIKFEAASVGGCHLSLPVLEETGTPHNKVFLERLEKEAL